MKMYAVIDKDNDIIAYHDKKRVVENYIDKIEKHHEQKLRYKKVKKSLLKGKDDLYLIRYADTYIQIGYYDFIDANQRQFIEDDQHALDVLYRLIETSRVNKKDTKTLIKAITILEDIVDDDRGYTPTIKELRTFRDMWEPYMHKDYFDGL